MIINGQLGEKILPLQNLLIAATEVTTGHWSKQPFSTLCHRSHITTYGTVG